MMTHHPPTILIANPSADVYGSDLQMLESVTALREGGYRVVAAIPDDGPLVSRLRDRGAEVEFISFPVLRRSNLSPLAFLQMAFAALVAVPRLVRYIGRTKPAAVYVNTVTLPWWLLASRLARVPTICHLHEAENADSRLIRRALITPLRLAHVIIVISQSAMSAMIEADSRLGKRGRLIYNGVPQPNQSPMPAARQEPFRVVTVGRLSPRKAPHLALEAVGRLRSRGYPVELEIVGSAFQGYEWYVAELESRAAEPDLAGAVRFTGYCSPIWPRLDRADLVVQPSLREPFGNAVVEAQMALRPVVATAALGHLESITDGETGLLVPAGDVDAMAAALARLIEDAELATDMAQRAQRSAKNRFSTDRYKSDIVSLFDSVTNLSSARPATDEVE